jgi:amidohydrolase
MAKDLLVYANQITEGKAVFVPEKKVLASEDFSHIAALVPSVFFGLQAPLPDAEGRTFPNHHPMAMFDPKIMPVGVATMAYSALQWLSDNS